MQLHSIYLVISHWLANGSSNTVGNCDGGSLQPTNASSARIQPDLSQHDTTWLARVPIFISALLRRFVGCFVCSMHRWDFSFSFSKMSHCILRLSRWMAQQDSLQWQGKKRRKKNHPQTLHFLIYLKFEVCHTQVGRGECEGSLQAVLPQRIPQPAKKKLRATGIKWGWLLRGHPVTPPSLHLTFTEITIKGEWVLLWVFLASPSVVDFLCTRVED